MPNGFDTRLLAFMLWVQDSVLLSPVHSSQTSSHLMPTYRLQGTRFFHGQWPASTAILANKKRLRLQPGIPDSTV